MSANVKAELAAISKSLFLQENMISTFLTRKIKLLVSYVEAVDALHEEDVVEGNRLVPPRCIECGEDYPCPTAKLSEILNGVSTLTE